VYSSEKISIRCWPSGSELDGEIAIDLISIWTISMT
jgi:hypothetical protein